MDQALTLQIPGVLHVLHNASKALKQVLDRFAEWLPLLQALCKLLHPPFRGRLLSTCIQSAEAAELIQAFSGTPYEQRWGTVVHATHSVLRLKTILQQNWNLQQYTFGKSLSKDAGEEEEEMRLRVQLADSAIRSQEFWLYTHMVDLLGDMLARLELLAESCCCHVPSAQVTALARGHTSCQDMELFRCEGCPLRGRRAPELATGDFHVALHTLAEQSYQALLALGWQATQIELTRVLEDFVKARGFLTASLELKLGPWLQLPYLIAAVAHPQNSKARAGVRKACLLYDSAQPEAQHPFSNFCLQPGTLRRELEFFVAGGSLDKLPAARALAARLRFAPVVERLVEGPHARVKRFTQHARHHSAAYIGFSLLRSSLESKCLQDSSYAISLASSCLLTLRHSAHHSAVDSFGE